MNARPRNARQLAKILVGWAANWTACVACLFLFVGYGCHAAESGEDAQVEVLKAWLVALVVRFACLEPLYALAHAICVPLALGSARDSLLLNMVSVQEPPSGPSPYASLRKEVPRRFSLRRTFSSQLGRFRPSPGARKYRI